MTAIEPMLGYVGTLVTVAFVFVAWIIIISVKAIKIANGFRTAKSFGLLVLSFVVVAIMTIQLEM